MFFLTGNFKIVGIDLTLMNNIIEKNLLCNRVDCKEQVEQTENQYIFLGSIN